MKNIDKIQTLLPLGYLYLVILGIAKEGLYYYQIGINIVTYSSIMDILISPIATITSHLIFTIPILLLFIFHYNLPKFLLKNDDKLWVQKLFDIKKNYENKDVTEEEKRNEYIFVSVKMLNSFLFSLYIGFGFGGGYFLSKKIKENKLQYEYKVNYNDGKSENIHLIGSNTTYYFFLSKGNPAIKITPVASIKNIEMTKKKSFY
ncbi:hypothetical protein GON26_16765 [Flavobacterium sp. GA093]|uniref:Uncharacterized protein n=1 Tax=Flavobacterium hydrocarbonoxydans TaxID=2683249 RepID=A0A6I4NWG3_9FLAO|nr:hypothetical protein [Flavobacterium hydrocarbonoxydans]MWB96019.1 hypothetical protein [Flavobacterium hydrocarbonoxydans]